MNKAAWLAAAEICDAWRVVPRLLVGGYAALVWSVTSWAMSLPDLSMAQSTFVSIVWGASAGVFGLYTAGGRKWVP